VNFLTVLGAPGTYQIFPCTPYSRAFRAFARSKIGQSPAKESEDLAVGNDRRVVRLPFTVASKRLCWAVPTRRSLHAVEAARGHGGGPPTTSTLPVTPPLASSRRSHERSGGQVVHVLMSGNIAGLTAGPPPRAACKQMSPQSFRVNNSCRHSFLSCGGLQLRMTPFSPSLQS
jgi:hypothetical protein